MPAGHGVLKKVGLAGVVSLVTIAAVDVCLRLWLNGPVYQMAWPEIPELSRFARDAEERSSVVGDLGVLTADRNDDQPREVLTTIDPFGFRNTPADSQTVHDLVVIGDSYGFGSGTTQDRTFASLLQDRYGLATYNLSMPNTGPWAQYINLALESDRLKLREGAIVLWAIFGGNDLDDRYGSLDVDQIPRNGPVDRAWVMIRRTRNRSPLYQALRRLHLVATGPAPSREVNVVPAAFVNGKTALFAKPYIEARRRTYADIVAHPNYSALARTVVAAKQRADKMRVSLKVMLVPMKEEVYGWLLDGREPWTTSRDSSGFAMALGEICARAHIDYLDLLPSFIDESKAEFARSGEMLWWYDDTHWNERGHALAASRTYRDLLAPK